MDVGEIDEDGDVRTVPPNRGLKAAKLAIDAGQVTDDLSNPHYRHILRSDDASQSGLNHAGSAHTNEGGIAAGQGKLVAQLVNEQCAIALAAVLAGGDEDDGIGHACLGLRPRVEFNNIVAETVGPGMRGGYRGT